MAWSLDRVLQKDKSAEQIRMDERKGPYTREMQFTLRVATEQDVAALTELIATSVRELQVEYSPADREAAIATVFSIDSRLISDETYFVAVSEDGRVAGCGGWSRRKTLYGGDHQVEVIKPELLDPAVDAAKIRAIFIHPAFARKGLGSAILETSERAALKEGFTRFEMGSTLTGVHLYRLKGYREVERIDVPVGTGQSISVVRMTKNV